MLTARREKHIPALDGIRGLAVLLVVLFHCMHMDHNANPFDTQIYRLSAACWSGVDLFFVLSGFLITGILLDAKEGHHYFRNFYARRVLRIFPLYYALLLVKLVILPMVTHAAPGSHHADIWYWLYVSNWAQGVGAPGLHHGLGLTWTLAIEEQFYMFWPLLVYFCDRRTLMRISLGMIAAAILFRITVESTLNLPYGQELTPARLDSLALGALAAMLLREIDVATLQRFAKTSLIAGGLILTAIFAKDGFWAGRGLMNSIGLSAWGLVFGGMVVFAATIPADRGYVKALTARPLLLLGKYSYAIYLLHATIDGALQRIAFGAGGAPPRVFGSQLPAQLVYYAVLLAACLAAGWLCWNLFEKWFLRLKSYFVYEPKVAVTPEVPQRDPAIFLTSPPAGTAG